MFLRKKKKVAEVQPQFMVTSVLFHNGQVYTNEEVCTGSPAMVSAHVREKFYSLAPNPCNVIETLNEVRGECSLGSIRVTMTPV